jgi:hypothetical protein
MPEEAVNAERNSFTKVDDQGNEVLIGCTLCDCPDFIFTRGPILECGRSTCRGPHGGHPASAHVF